MFITECFHDNADHARPTFRDLRFVGLVGRAIVSELFGGSFPRKRRVASLSSHPTAKVGTPMAGEFPPAS
jgi:hypothetical protein